LRILHHLFHKKILHFHKIDHSCFMKTATAQLLDQRSFGSLTLSIDKAGPQVLREAGASKLRLPRSSTQAIIINTGGGLAGGDRFEHSFSCGAQASLTLTSQAAERVYQTLGPPAEISTRLSVEQGGQLFWLPQETILYDGASLNRSYFVTLARDSKFLSIEPLVFGRTEMGEKLASVHLKDRWRIWHEGRLLHADDVELGLSLPASKATLAGATAMATLVYVATDAEAHLEHLRGFCACSAWNGRLISRFTAKDGYHLRKALIPAIKVLAGIEALPKIWTA
jgi:urease accessory protein